MTYDDLIEDLHEFIEKHHIESPVLLGHSMGGKTAMAFAQKYPDKIDRLIVADISPRDYGVHLQPILDTLNSVDFNTMKDRKRIQEHLMNHINNLEIVLFLAKNVYWKDKDHLAYRFNLPVLNNSIAQISGWKNDQEVYNGTSLFIRGGVSPYIKDDESSISSQFPNAEIKTILGAGHWLHAEKPDEFYQLVHSFMLG
jgi:pimeloyl-ACP methyl ester carboxylesterase